MWSCRHCSRSRCQRWPQGDAEREVLEQEVFAVGLGNVFDFNNFGAKTGALSHQNFNFCLVALALLISQLFVPLNPSLVLGLAAGRALLYPFQFAFGAAFCRLDSPRSSSSSAFALLLEPRGIVAFQGMPSPRSSSKIQPATLSRKYRSWVTAMIVPSYWAKCCSSQCTLSASRWLVGSSSSRMAGFCSSSRQRATRLRSPPESSLTGRSEGGHRRASMAMFNRASRSHAPASSSFSCKSPCFSRSFSISSGVISSANFSLMAS